MARSHLLDADSIPKEIYVNNKPVAVSGCHYRVNTSSYFTCLCGHQISTKDFREDKPNLEGRVCPQCGRVVEPDSVLYLNGYYYRGNECYNKYEINVKKMTITQVSYEYKLEEVGDKLWKVISLPAKREVHTFADIGNRHKVPEFIRTELIENYADKLDPILRALLESKSSYASNYYGKLSVAKTFFDQSPAMAEAVMNAIRGDQYHGKDITYDVFESLYPEYMRPLTPRLVRDYNPLDGIRYSYSKKEFKPEHEYKSYEALAYVINLYKSELISFNQMYDLLMSPEALNNPLFVASFKKNFMQMNSFVNELVTENRNPEYVNMDLKTHYWNKTREFFKDYGYTDEQFDAAFNGKGSTLQQFIAMGSTRRSRK